jgi:ribose 5-phosphate isomerase B
MKIVLGSDHAGFDVKSRVADFLFKRGIEVIDRGPESEERTDYPIYTFAVIKRMRELEGSRGILICGSGIGVAMCANRFQGIRAARCLSVADAEMTRSHNDCNLLCLGARVTEFSLMEQIIMTWLQTPFAGDRHQDRLNFFKNLGQGDF